MQWIKSHLTIVVCSSLSLVAIVLMVLGVVLSDVKAAMEQDSSLYTNLQRVQGVNRETIDEAQRRQAALGADLEAFIKQKEQVTARKPLLPEVFDESNPSDQAEYALQFRHMYQAKQRDLLKDVLNARGEPSAEFVDDVARDMAARQAESDAQERTGLESPRGRSRTGSSYSRRPTSVMGRTTAGSDLSPEELVQVDPEVRASVLRAREIYCYAEVEDLDDRPEITESKHTPTMKEIWYAQVSLWIQEDVITALAKVNREAAEKLPEAERWVGYLPVKHLLSYRLSSHYAAPSTGGAAVSGAGMPMSIGRGSSFGRSSRGSESGSGSMGQGAVSDAPAFTGRGSTPQVDVIRFNLELVIDAAGLLAVLDEVCQAGFYTPLTVEYEEEPPNEEFRGALYGPDPTLNVRVLWEASFLRAGYEAWLPKAVADEISGRGAGASMGGRASPVRSSPGRRASPAPTRRGMGGVPEGL